MRTKTNDTTVAKGREAELRAERHLQNCGFQQVDRNFRVRGGEIDLIMRDGETLVFVEVRQRSSKDYGGAGASITALKQRRIVLAARHYLARRGDCECRFDCVLIDGDTLDWVRDAFVVDTV